MSFALITGGSGGIGLEIARRLASLRYHVLLVARSEEALRLHAEAIAQEFGVQTDYLAIDLTAEGAVDAVYSWAIRDGRAVEILVNNAGYALWGRTDRLDPGKTQNMIRLNVNVLVAFCARFIPLLLRNPKSYILNVSSSTAYQAVPYLSAYAASKVFVLSFTRGLRWELRNSPISVSCISPGPTSTGFIDRADMGALKDSADKVSMTAEAVACIAVDGMLSGKAEIIPGGVNRFSVWLIGLLPKALVEHIANRIYQRGGNSAAQG